MKCGSGHHRIGSVPFQSITAPCHLEVKAVALHPSVNQVTGKVTQQPPTTQRTSQRSGWTHLAELITSPQRERNGSEVLVPLTSGAQLWRSVSLPFLWPFPGNTEPSAAADPDQVPLCCQDCREPPRTNPI